MTQYQAIYTNAAGQVVEGVAHAFLTQAELEGTLRADRYEVRVVVGADTPEARWASLRSRLALENEFAERLW